MAHPYHHSLSSVKRWGGVTEDYQEIHDFLDSSKSHFGDIRHRALYHHSGGIFLCEKLFGIVVTNSNGRQVPVRSIAERHVMEDCGRIPSPSDWLSNMNVQPWMRRVGTQLSHLEDSNHSNVDTSDEVLSATHI
jgi:hypothetical protein